MATVVRARPVWPEFTTGLMPADDDLRSANRSEHLRFAGIEHPHRDVASPGQEPPEALRPTMPARRSR